MIMEIWENNAKRPNPKYGTVSRRHVLGVLATGTSLAAVSGHATGRGLDEMPHKATPPEGAYIPEHMDMMKMIGMETAERLMVSLSYTRPHEFFLVTGTRTNNVEIQTSDTMHLMTMVHDMQTGAIAPQVEPTITVSRDGDELVSNQPWPMLSQPMGFHFGDNVAVSGQAAYRFDVTVNAAQSVLPDELGDVFTKQSITFEAEFDPASASELGQKHTGDEAGTAGALPPMEMDGMSIPQQPAYDEFPIELTGPQYTDDLGVAVGTHDDPTSLGFTDGEIALVAATQTKYNRYPLGFMGVEATVTRDGDEVFADELSSAVDGELGHYYGAGTPALEVGDTVDLEFTTPPQVARHRGYERAFLELDTLTFTL